MTILEPPAVDLSKNCVKPPELRMNALPAVDLFKKNNWPPSPIPSPGLFVNTLLPAVALFENTIVPTLPEISAGVTKFCVAPELLVMPTPLMVSVNPGLAVMV